MCVPWNKNICFIFKSVLAKKSLVHRAPLKTKMAQFRGNFLFKRPETPLMSDHSNSFLPGRKLIQFPHYTIGGFERNKLWQERKKRDLQSRFAITEKLVNIECSVLESISGIASLVLLPIKKLVSTQKSFIDSFSIIVRSKIASWDCTCFLNAHYHENCTVDSRFVIFLQLTNLTFIAKYRTRISHITQFYNHAFAADPKLRLNWDLTVQ